MDKNLFWFFQIHLHLAETSPAKSGLKQEKSKNLKKGLKYGFDSPNWWHL
jgi:hypothetical protein